GREPTLVRAGLARQYGDGSLLGLFRDYLDVLFGVQVELFVRFGLALESHQQNTTLVLDPERPDRPPRLLVKDFDGALIHHRRLAAGRSGVPEAAALSEPRLLTGSAAELA